MEAVCGKSARTLVWQNADPPPSTKAGAYAEYVL